MVGFCLLSLGAVWFVLLSLPSPLDMLLLFSLMA
jgi:hypothetical protein